MQKNSLYDATLLLIFFFLLFAGLWFAAELLIPLSFAILLAMLMIPLGKWFEKKGLNKGLSIIICLGIIFITIAGIIFIFSYQVAGFAKNFSQMQGVFMRKFDTIQHFIETKLNISSERQIAIVKERVAEMSNLAGQLAKNVLIGTTGAAATVALIFVYIFFFMYYRSKFKNFVFMIAPKEVHAKAREIIEDASSITQQYLSGVLIVIVVLAILNSVGLMFVGIDNAIFFGCLAAILNVVPYIGVLIGSLFPIVYSLLTQDSYGSVLAVMAVLGFNQFLENNFLTPNIVGSKVKINPLAAVVALVIGGLLWGIAGMILFIPFLGILKIIFDKVDALKPYGYLIGDDDDQEGETTWNKIKKWFIHKKKKRTLHKKVKEKN